MFIRIGIVEGLQLCRVWAVQNPIIAGKILILLPKQACGAVVIALDHVLLYVWLVFSQVDLIGKQEGKFSR